MILAQYRWQTDWWVGGVISTCWCLCNTCVPPPEHRLELVLGFSPWFDWGNIRETIHSLGNEKGFFNLFQFWSWLSLVQTLLRNQLSFTNDYLIEPWPCLLLDNIHKYDMWLEGWHKYPICDPLRRLLHFDVHGSLVQEMQKVKILWTIFFFNLATRRCEKANFRAHIGQNSCYVTSTAALNLNWENRCRSDTIWLYGLWQ